MNTPHTTFAAMGTTWAVFCDRADLLPGAARLVEDAERQLSRFLADSWLSRLNTRRIAEHALLASVVRAALRLRTATHGAFDPTVGAELVALGYDHSFELLKPQSVPMGWAGRLHVDVVGDEVTLEGAGLLDLGGIAKGFTVDLVHDWLRDRGATKVLVDGGGDIRGSGTAWPIGVGPGLVAWLNGDAVATSSTVQRSWASSLGGVAHHVIDPSTRRSSTSGVVTTTVRAPDASTADALATAALVDPVRVLPCLGALGAEALVQEAAGRWWATAGWEAA